MNEDVRKLRAWLEKDRQAIIGGIGGCEAILERALDRLEELEWFVSVLRKDTQS